MGSITSLTAADGHSFDAYRVGPQGMPKASVVVIQEIFGANSHIREVADTYAAEGDDVAAGRKIRGNISWDDALKDVDAAIAAIRGTGKVGVIGYCWGGSLAWLTATRLRADAAICYYGGQVPDFSAEKPGCPTMLHFGELDSSISLEGVETVRNQNPDLPLFIYKGAGHGFNCDHRSSYNAKCAAQARQRTLAVYAETIG
ncbi:MAG: dienelactone hydrolase family protein [Rhodospirillales bacterium]